eukprot:TRINITY_DN2188_c2_g1_i1.p1 TRINITY_DN2188_c2_g1~~TRINITY_DN2188_c2_g1_i1.p1  ORF type:complete len:886 (+),score=146.76 TRINITY_DN2188_c2_g1_i1:389-2659(+)
MTIATPWAHGGGVANWDTQAGYNSDGRYLDFFGMAHSALSGAGTGELGELRLLPGGNQRSVIDTASASGRPGYFKGNVLRDGRPLCLIESSATPRGAIHRFSFDNKVGNTGIQVNLKEPSGAYWGYKLKQNDMKIVGQDRLEGCSYSVNVGIGHAEQYLCFALKFDSPFEGKPSEYNGAIQLDFKTAKTVTARVGISRTSLKHAQESLKREVEGRSFSQITEAAAQLWQSALEKVKVEVKPQSRKRSFYSALYHSMLAPTLFSEEDGSYRLQRKKIADKMSGEEFFSLAQIDEYMPVRYTKGGHRMYTTFSMWDTYRGLHPLMNLIQPEVSEDFGMSLMSFVDAWGYLPRFQLIGSPTDIMEGDPGSIILGTMAREGIVNKTAALAAIRTSRMANVDNRGTIAKEGFFHSSSVSQALEQASADSCASRLAEDVGQQRDKALFRNRANSAFKFWDGNQGVFAMFDHPGSFRSISNKNEQSSPYTEGTPLHYSFGAEFDVDQMIRKHGGEAQFVRHLDYFFNEAPEQHGQRDLTGSHHALSLGNEVTMHTTYLYSLAHQPRKSQELIDGLVKEMFSDKANGLPGNDDMGAMSSWLALSLLGFYPVDPCSGSFVLGRPFIENAELSVKGGKFTVQVHNQGEKNKYINRISLNGEDLDINKPVVSFQQLSKQGLLEIWMSANATLPSEKELAAARLAEDMSKPQPLHNFEKQNTGKQNLTSTENSTLTSASATLAGLQKQIKHSLENMHRVMQSLQSLTF